jgi:cation diffusion facilitator CzcD-associated flavoprotein CzcO
LTEDMLRQESVTNIEYDFVNSFEDAEQSSVISNMNLEDEIKVFRITTNQGVNFARVVILAVGPGNAPCIPSIPGLPKLCPHEGYTHAMQIKQFPPPHIKAKIESRRPTKILIVGGGLTSIQLADLAIKRGVSKVWLLMRGDLKVKYFDVDLDWVGKFRNFKQAEFWTADTDEGTFRHLSYLIPTNIFQNASK